jgi:type III pantothenate kinase
MSELLLTLDRGNSTLDAMLHGEPPRRERLASADPRALLAFLGADLPGLCACATVVPGGLDAAAGQLQDLGCRVLRADRDLPCPLALDYETPGSLGADRWIGAFCAHARFGAALVVDCGSATTLSLVDAGGTFRGGAIAPGFAAFAAGMVQLTPQLPAIDLRLLAPLPARSSAACVAAGAVFGYCGMVERLVADHQQVVGGAATVVLTGGNAGLCLQHGRFRSVHVPDLVHQGLRLLVQRSGCAS